jgi:hypothetical protein
LGSHGDDDGTDRDDGEVVRCGWRGVGRDACRTGAGGGRRRVGGSRCGWRCRRWRKRRWWIVAVGESGNGSAAVAIASASDAIDISNLCVQRVGSAIDLD